MLLIPATIREAWRWVRGRIDPPPPPPSETVRWLEEVRRRTRAERLQRRRDWLENALVYQDEGKEPS